MRWFCVHDPIVDRLDLRALGGRLLRRSIDRSDGALESQSPFARDRGVRGAFALLGRLRGTSGGVEPGSGGRVVSLRTFGEEPVPLYLLWKQVFRRR